MKHTYRHAVIAILACGLPAPDLLACVAPPGSTRILLKLDDVVAARGSTLGVSAKWDKVARYLESTQTAASFGIIGESLEESFPAYFDWIKRRVASGLIELWNHGYKFRFVPNTSLGEVGEFNGTSAEKQFQVIGRTQTLIQQRVGVVSGGWGPHSSAVDSKTFAQLDAYPSIRYVWFYKPLDSLPHQATVIRRTVDMETPIFHPNLEAFIKMYQNRDRSIDYVALQGHPNEWDDVGYASFVRIVEWLRREGATFCKPSDLFGGR